MTWLATIIALLVLAAVQVAGLWVTRTATAVLLPVPEGPGRRARFFFAWLGAGLVNSAALGIVPALAASLLERWLAPLEAAIGAMHAGFGVLAWAYPLWVQVRGPARAGGARDAE